MDPDPENQSTTQPLDAQPLPDQIGRYRILGRLGAGGMGTVYKAHDPQLDRVVALKVPRFDWSPQDRCKRLHRFQREARAAAQVWHPITPREGQRNGPGPRYPIDRPIPGRPAAAGPNRPLPHPPAPGLGRGGI